MNLRGEDRDQADHDRSDVLDESELPSGYKQHQYISANRPSNASAHRWWL